METIIDEYQAADSEGNLYNVVLMQALVPAGHLKDPYAVVKGTKRLTVDGQNANWVDENTARLLDGTIVIRV